MNARQRTNLLKLATYLESLPEDYTHFDMGDYTGHNGSCRLPMPKDLYAAKQPTEFLSNCGTVACAVGHGPAAGVSISPVEIRHCRNRYIQVDWAAYAERAFGTSPNRSDSAFEFLFGVRWKRSDNHHYGAAARIRYVLAGGKISACPGDEFVKRYSPYRKGSRSAKRREIEAVSA